jgi:uncharacterized protein with GYD domain
LRGGGRIEDDRAIPHNPRDEEVLMAQYLGRISYTSDAVRALMDSPQDRSAAAREVVESLGGKLLGFWFALGEFDAVFIVDAPDNATAAAVAMVVGGSGAIANFETTALLGMDEAQEAMRKAGGATYHRPGG